MSRETGPYTRPYQAVENVEILIAGSIEEVAKADKEVVEAIQRVTAVTSYLLVQCSFHPFYFVNYRAISRDDDLFQLRLFIYL